jgi:uncharacterized protein
MKSARRAFSAVLILLVLLTSTVYAEGKFPEPTSKKYVNDYINLLSSDVQDNIISIGNELYQKTGAEAAVVVIDTTGDMSIEEYANGLFREWGIGNKQKNNGVLLLVAVNDRKMRIEVGYGLEGILPDGKTGRIRDEYIIPYFKQNNYADGVINGYRAICTEVAKEYNVQLNGADPAPAKNSDSNNVPSAFTILMMMFVVFMFFSIFFRGRGRRYPGGWGGSGGDSGGGFFGGSGGDSGGGGFGGGDSGGGGSSGSW